MQVAGKPGDAYNPLFIYGVSAFGKTHLLQAIGNQLLREHPTARVRYIHAERFMCRTSLKPTAQGVGRVLTKLCLFRSAADRRHPVLQQQEQYAGTVFLICSMR